MKEKKLEKLKRFLKEDGVRLGYYTLGFAAGVTGTYLYHKCYVKNANLGLKRAVEEGYLILTKPTDGSEVLMLNPSEWLKEIKVLLSKN